MNSILKNRQFLLLLGGQGISIFGDQIYLIGLMWTIMKQTGSAMSLGTTVICMMLPSVLVMPWAGVFADQNIKKQILMISDLVRGLIMFVITMLALEGHFSLPLINLFLVLISMMDAFFNPALSATIPLVLDLQSLSKGNAIFEFIRRISTVLGPVVGGMLITVLSISSIFAINGFSFFVSFFFSLFLKIPPVSQSAAHDSFFLRFKEGFLYTLRMKRLLCLTLVGGVVINFFLAPLDVLLIVVSQQMKFGASGLGFIEGAISIGALAGSAAVLFGHIRNHVRLAIIGLVLEGVALTFASIIPELSTLILFFGLLGLGVSFASIGIGTTFQLITEEDKRGRASSFSTMLGSCTVPLGILFGSFLTDRLSVQWVLFSFGLIVVFSGTTLYFPFKNELSGAKNPKHAPGFKN